MDPQDDLEAQAIELIREWGPVHVGNPAGDFNVITLLTGLAGWLPVTITTFLPMSARTRWKANLET